MAKRKTFAKKSINRLPKGLPIRAGDGANRSGKRGHNSTSTTTTTTTTINPFEMTQHMKRPKFAVHNRGTNTTTATQPPPKLSALAVSLSQRQESIRNLIQASKKSNQFIDQRIGEAGSSRNNKNMDQNASSDAKNLARLVRERTRQSKRLSKYALSSADDDDDNGDGNADHILTHKGTAIKDMTDVDHVILSDDDEDENGNLDAYDTELHFGGTGMTRKDTAMASTYGARDTNDLSTAYTQKKLDLDDLILRRKTMKLERIQSREAQISTFDAMDTSFQQLASLLQFRNKDDEIKAFIEQKRQHALSKEDQEYDDWDREMKQYLHVEKKVAATDRTKTPEEIAKEEADQLHELETRRLARMNGDFDDDDNDDLDDWSESGNKHNKRRKLDRQKKKIGTRNPEELDNDDDSDGDEKNKATTTTRFTSEGLVYVNQDGEVIGKVGDGTHDPNEDIDDDDSQSEDDSDDDADSADDDDDDAENENDKPSMIQKHYYKVGDRVMANFRAKEQFDGHEAWYHGTITKVVKENDNDDDEEEEPTITYNIEYDDGDFEDNVEPQSIRLPGIVNDPASTTTTNINDNEDEADIKGKAMELKRKRQKVMEKARYVSLRCVYFICACTCATVTRVFVILPNHSRLSIFFLTMTLV